MTAIYIAEGDTSVSSMKQSGAAYIAITGKARRALEAMPRRMGVRLMADQDVAPRLSRGWRKHVRALKAKGQPVPSNGIHSLLRANLSTLAVGA
jgi:hypothetical protein